MKVKFLVVLTLAFAILLSACGKSDADLQSAADKALKGDESTATVTVDVKDGVATISGDVKDEAAKAQAETLAKVEGVKSVANNVMVMPTPVMPQASGDDPEVKSKIEAALQKKGCDGAMVDVKDGTATLTGTVAADKYPECIMAVNEAKPKKLENKLEKK